jgi:hypothetical protein
MEERTSRRRPGLVLTDTDHELFRWLWMLRVLTLGQLQRLGYYQPETGRVSSLHNVRKRLRRLWDKGYLSGDTLLATRERIYHLAERALPPLRERFDIEQQRLYQPAGSPQSLRQVHHALMVSECAVRVVESIRKSMMRVADLPPLAMPLYHTHAVGNVRTKKHVERFVTQEDLHLSGRPKPLRIRPDLVFALVQDSPERIPRNSVGRLYFLEADRGTESPREIAGKLLAYHHYAEYLDPLDSSRYLWQRYGDMRDFRVLLVTTDDRRVATLVRALARKPGFELTAVTTIDAVKERNLVFDPIWTNALGPERALAKRL